MPADKVASVLLAGGFSTRVPGVNKLLLPWRGGTLIRCVAERLQASNSIPIFVVLGHDSESIKNALTGFDLSFVINESPEAGMGVSIAVGTRAVIESESAASGVLIALGDMPWLETADYDAVVAALDGQQDRIVVPRCGDRLGNPVVFGRSYFEDLACLNGDEGAKRIIKAHPDSVRYVDFGSTRPFEDIDALSDLQSR